jgi:hypothetical protein
MTLLTKAKQPQLIIAKNVIWIEYSIVIPARVLSALYAAHRLNFRKPEIHTITKRQRG